MAADVQHTSRFLEEKTARPQMGMASVSSGVWRARLFFFCSSSRWSVSHFSRPLTWRHGPRVPRETPSGPRPSTSAGANKTQDHHRQALTRALFDDETPLQAVGHCTRKRVVEMRPPRAQQVDKQDAHACSHPQAIQPPKRQPVATIFGRDALAIDLASRHQVVCRIMARGVRLV